MSMEFPNIGIRAIERYGGYEETSALLWLDHVAGIAYKNDDGVVTTYTTESLAEDYARHSKDRVSEMRHSLTADDLLIYDNKADWLRAMALHMLPIRISADRDQPAPWLEAEFKLFKTPRELARSPTIVVETTSLAEALGFEEEVDPDAQRPSKSAREFVVTMALRLTPRDSEITGIGYYPGYLSDEAGLAAMEADETGFRMQLHHLIYLEILRRASAQPLAELIAPHQF